MESRSGRQMKVVTSSPTNGWKCREFLGRRACVHIDRNPSGKSIVLVARFRFQSAAQCMQVSVCASACGGGLLVYVPVTPPSGAVIPYELFKTGRRFSRRREGSNRARPTTGNSSLSRGTGDCSDSVGPYVRHSRAALRRQPGRPPRVWIRPIAGSSDGRGSDGALLSCRAGSPGETSTTPEINSQIDRIRP